MRIIVHGVGAIGGVVAAGLALSGQEVVGIARGRMLEAIRARGGLDLLSLRGRELAEFPCIGHPSELEFRPDDAVLLCMKSQDTVDALEALRAAGLRDQPVFCCQNGVANERMALRLFPNVHGVTVMMPASYLQPGEVVTHGGPRFGIFDIGRYPEGVDQADEALCAALEAANIAAFAQPDVMQGKYGKLLMNLGNIVGALLPQGTEAAPFSRRLKAEAEAVLEAAGIAWRDVGAGDPRRKELMQMVEVEGAARAGNSTRQSLERAAGSLETDYLNGEIALMGRLHAVPAPLNARMAELAAELVASGKGAGSMSAEALEAVFSR